MTETETRLRAAADAAPVAYLVNLPDELPADGALWSKAPTAEDLAGMAAAGLPAVVVTPLKLAVDDDIRDALAQLAAARAEVDQLRAREKACATIDQADKVALLRGLQECAAALSLDDPSPAQLVAAVQQLAADKAPDVDDINAQKWAGMDASTAFWLVQRHADDWSHAGRLLNAWRLANPVLSRETEVALNQAALAVAIHGQYPATTDYDRGYGKGRADGAESVRALAARLKDAAGG